MTESGIAFRPECKKTVKTINPDLSPFIPDFFGSLKEFVGSFLMSFSHWAKTQSRFPSFPRKAGTQIRDVPVDRVSLGFCPCFPVRATLGPRVRGDDERGESRETWAEDREKGIT
jgi:hypothetical protein